MVNFSGNGDGYDPLDPNGNISIKWDIIEENDDNQVVTVSIFNYQLYRHIDHPGWKLSWQWPGDGVIWDMWGAEATEQGNCSAFKSGQRPHCCEKKPVIIDLLPGTRYNKQFLNCCKGGVLSSMTQDPEKYLAAFQMSIGRVSSKSSKAAAVIPGNFTLGVPGYTCGEAFEVPPSKFVEDHGRRRTQAVGTWNITCSYSQFRAQSSPTCCVSLSAFYNKTIVSCPICTCGCEGQPGSAKCLKAGEQPPVVQLQHYSPPRAIVQCTKHMCPIRVHWHVKLSYTQHWRVKITITNYNFAKNFSQWNLVVLHPNLGKVTRVFSFNYRPLNQYGDINDTGMFYGIQYYNDMLLQAGKGGNVQTELLLNKDPTTFTFREGWGFPRRISFNGEECVLPQPDDYPRLPNSAPADSCLLQLLFLLFLVTFVV
ncbi:COBRA-like protein 6 [Ipomoea triloba]|uniref:COBRA-like protein 6 n=1 Tax=Ipomoea triloba TaxID=35885 RepID=UPI00125DFB11|nr:COBRA-like protein 6 [Ipomoea triloba]